MTLTDQRRRLSDRLHGRGVDLVAAGAKEDGEDADGHLAR